MLHVLADVASESETRWNGLFYLYMTIALLVGALVIGWTLLSIVRFRARPGAPRPKDAPIPGFLQPERGTVLFSWIIALTIAAIMFGLAFSTIHAVDAIENPPPNEPSIHVDVTGFQFGWKYNYTGEGGIPFQTIGEWTIPINEVVTIDVRSQDVWHNFAFPNGRIRVDAIPGETNHLWYRATTLGDDRNACVQICGAGHATMHSVLHVVPAADFATYLHQNSQDAYTSLSHKSLVNATWDGAALTIVGHAAGKASALNLTNTGSQPADFHLQGSTATVTVPAGGSAFLYVPAGSGTETLVGPNGATGSVS
ncbi:MAG: cytochrome c oxidase subunit [Thermoplasmata archaeon]|jgi:cytochrome c oxidase subunit 2|nr:cytochrome c oxidase subunit [Thermoplasmata archaeon]